MADVDKQQVVPEGVGIEGHNGTDVGMDGRE